MKRTILSILFACFIGSGVAQTRIAESENLNNNSSSFDWNRVTFGGNLGLQFGDYTVVNIAPQIGYNLTNYFNAGFGISYTYYQEKGYIGNERITDKYNYFGVNIYGRANLWDYIVVQAQPEINFMSYSQSGSDEKINKTVPSFLVGAGVHFGPMTAMLQYDVVQNEYTPYGNHIFYSIGYSF